MVSSTATIRYVATSARCRAKKNALKFILKLVNKQSTDSCLKFI